jgi:hypothetical protein
MNITKKKITPSSKKNESVASKWKFRIRLKTFLDYSHDWEAGAIAIVFLFVKQAQFQKVCIVFYSLYIPLLYKTLLCTE